MKTALRIISISIVLVMMAVLLSSCGQLSGTYKSEEILSAYTQYEFSCKNVTIVIGSALGKVEFKGTYEVKNDKITFTFGDKDAAKYSGEHSFEKDGNTIKIDGVAHTKQ